MICQKDKIIVLEMPCPRPPLLPPHVLLMVEMSHTYMDGEASTSELCLGKAPMGLVDIVEFPVFGMPHYGYPPPHPKGCTCDRNLYPYFRN